MHGNYCMSKRIVLNRRFKSHSAVLKQGQNIVHYKHTYIWTARSSLGVAYIVREISEITRSRYLMYFCFVILFYLIMSHAHTLPLHIAINEFNSLRRFSLD